MRLSLAKIAISLTIIPVAMSLAAPPALARPPARDRTAAAVMSVEHDWLAALHRRDVKTLARILGREFIDSDFAGGAITRAEYLEYFAQPLGHPVARVRQTFTDTRVRFVADGKVALVTGIVITRPIPRPGDNGSAKGHAIQGSRFTDVFVWRGARWQAVTGQETHFTPDMR
jgi:hypothetical protein